MRRKQHNSFKKIIMFVHVQKAHQRFTTGHFHLICALTRKFVLFSALGVFDLQTLK